MTYLKAIRILERRLERLVHRSQHASENELSWVRAEQSALDLAIQALQEKLELQKRA